MKITLQDIIYQYTIEEKSITQIAKEYKTYGVYISNILKNNNINIRKSISRKQNLHYKGTSNITGKSFFNIQKDAIKRNIKFDIDIKTIHDLLKLQNNKCVLTGETISDNDNIYDASLDRIDNLSYYHKDNIWWLHKKINQIKYIYPIELVYFHINNIYNNKIKDINKQLYFNIKRSKKFTGYKWISGKLYTKYKYDAKSRKLEFNISIKDMWDVFVSQKGLCNISNHLITFVRDDTSEPFTRTASLDRLDPDIGYTIDNIQWVHRDIQFMKLKLNNNIFLEWCKKIYDHQDNSKKIIKEIYGLDINTYNYRYETWRPYNPKKNHIYLGEDGGK